MTHDVLYTPSLQYEVKSLRRQVAELQSGEKYRSIKTALIKQLRAKEQELQKEKLAHFDSRRMANEMRDNWMEVNEALVKECAKRIRVWVLSLLPI